MYAADPKRSGCNSSTHACKQLEVINIGALLDTATPTCNFQHKSSQNTLNPVLAYSHQWKLFVDMLSQKTSW